MGDRQPDTTLVFIKLGGSLITDKDHAETALPERIETLLREIQALRLAHPGTQILLGHGSGSFGHQAAHHYGTRDGVFSSEDWLGFQAVWQSARKLNTIITTICTGLGLPIIVFPPSASVVAQNHEITAWNLAPIQQALSAGLIPLVYGDVVTDLEVGGTILSTEDLFAYLAKALRPQRILLAGIEAGVYADYPANTHLIDQLPANLKLQAAPEASASIDVTGGMASKVSLMQALVRALPGLQVRIFSGLERGNLSKAFTDADIGTRIT